MLQEIHGVQNRSSGFRSGQQFFENFKIFPARFQGGKIFQIYGLAERILKIQDLASKISRLEAQFRHIQIAVSLADIT